MNETKRPVGRPPNLKIAQLMKRHKCSRATAYRLAAGKPKLREQSKRTMVERGLDPYFTTPEALISLLLLERAYIPGRIWDPFAGDGAIINLMAQFGYETYASDIEDYGLEGCQIVDYRVATVPDGVAAIVSNPPFAWALEFLERALAQVPYVAFLLRSHFLIEGSGRDRFLEEHPPARVYYATLRLPRTHHIGWTGKRSSSQTPYAWCVWDRYANRPELPQRFNWRDIWREYEAGRLDLGPM